MKYLYLFVVLSLMSAVSSAQTTGVFANGTNANAITTAVPFLTISPDARSGALGEAGVALSPDANATFWNPSKLAFVEEPTSFTASYSPWMRTVFPDVNLAYLSFYRRLDDRNTIAASMRYFNLGSVNSYDDVATSLGTLHPNEFSFDVSIARKYGENFSLGLTARYVRSNLTQGAVVSGVQTQASSAVAADVSLYYKKPNATGMFAFGVDISNIGTKMSYSDGGPQYFLPTNLKLGIAETYNLDDNDELTFALDLNKLLVPTPSQYVDANGNLVNGSYSNQSVVSGIFSSFTDAPGGLGEELQEISASPGFEYWYMKTLAIRAGYFFENPIKGNRQYATLGAGFRYHDIDLDLSYIAANQSKTPLANVLRISLGYNFGSVKK